MQSKVCLNITIDHRMRELFKPVTVNRGAPSQHVSQIQSLGEALGRSHEEVQVTSELAGPAVKGGIVVTLQQPRDNHPYEHGIDCVIEDCQTLHALYEVFRVVSCETLDIRTDVSIVDLLPYVSEDVREVDETDLEYLSEQTLQAIREKNPGVVLCAGKLRIPESEDPHDVKGNIRLLGSIGVGRVFDQKFGNSSKIPVWVQGDAHFVERVNGFHPSFAMNHHPHISLLRQLLILVCAEACGVLRRDWKDTEWTKGLKSRCRELSSSLSEGLTLTPRYIPAYGVLYADALQKLTVAAIPLMANWDPSRVVTNYDDLLSSNLSEICNNASLILRQMESLCEEGWPDHFDKLNTDALRRNRENTSLHMRAMLRAAARRPVLQILSIMQKGATLILDCVMTDRISGMDARDSKSASSAFLDLAIDIETLLSDLLFEREKTLYLAFLGS